jgi:hypothetical protein
VVSVTIIRHTVRYEAPDADNEPTIWQHDQGSQPRAMLRRCDLPHEWRGELWPLIVRAVAS